MRTRSLIIARREITGSLRDKRSLASGIMYALMGPMTILMVAFATRNGLRPDSRLAVLYSMTCVFTLVAAFVGGMNIAIDCMAGERERRSLLPLLINPVTRFEVVFGKWIATSLFALCGLLLNLGGFLLVFVLPASAVTLPASKMPLIFAVLLGMCPLALFAAALELLISISARSMREAHTYLSALIGVPMAIGMMATFFPHADMWLRALPLFGHYVLLDESLQRANSHFLLLAALGCLTGLGTLLVVMGTYKMLQRDAVIYGT